MIDDDLIRLYLDTEVMIHNVQESSNPFLHRHRPRCDKLLSVVAKVNGREFLFIKVHTEKLNFYQYSANRLNSV